ncbi:KTSC domain-containing protein [Erwinia sp. E_sp_B01_3]|uniref:KTSC domain-containing protein n=1 Tax=unclassified Erwinia TaxID=2622719 RepID=UPI0030CD4015
MIRKPVTSSILKSVGYDADTSTLEISFRYGIVNQYFGVRTHIYSGLMNAASKREFFNQNIKSSYPFRNVG